jgi:uncharacterized protein
MGFSILIRFSSILAIVSLLVLQGCTTAAQKSAGMRISLEQGRPDLALMDVEKEGESDDVMVNMNLGILRSMNRDFKGSNAALEIAKEKIQELYSTSITEQAAAVIVNDETISFDGDRYEQVLVHAYKALNYISMGDLDAARVEILQSDVKMMEWGDSPEEDPFIRYLSGIVFEALGEKDSALVSYRQAVDVYKSTKERHGLGVPAQLKHDLLTLLANEKLWGEYKDYKKEFAMSGFKAKKTRGKGELILIMNNGLVPQREQESIHSYSTVMLANVKIALPTYPNLPRYVDQMRLTIGGKTKVLETIENVDGLARAALKDDIVVITTRAIARAVAKKATEKEAGDQGGVFGQLAMMVINQATEIADTRCWNTLPQQIQLGRVLLPAGEHNLKVEVIGAGGVLRDTINMSVNIKAGRKTILNQYWTAPVPVAPVAGMTTAAN